MSSPGRIARPDPTRALEHRDFHAFRAVTRRLSCAQPRDSRAAAILAVPALAYGLQAPASAASAAPAAASHLTTRNLLPGLSHATDLGPAAAASRMSLVVGVARPSPAAEDRYLAAENNPASPLYHQFLTPSAFAAKFGVRASTRRAVTSWLTSSGLHVDGISAAGDTVAVSGTAAQVASTFRTGIRRFRTGTTTFLANTPYPAIPAGLPVTTVVGLNTLQKFSTPAKPHGHRTPASGPPASA